MIVAISKRVSLVQAETRLQNEIRLEASASCRHATLWRNHTGALRDERGRLVHFGLSPGSSDLIGIREIEITADMVGQKIGQFVALEIKTPAGRVRNDQHAFLDHIQKKGGLGAVVRSANEAVQILQGGT